MEGAWLPKTEATVIICEWEHDCENEAVGMQYHRAMRASVPACEEHAHPDLQLAGNQGNVPASNQGPSTGGYEK